jgi:hypothetical protein
MKKKFLLLISAIGFILTINYLHASCHADSTQASTSNKKTELLPSRQGRTVSLKKEHLLAFPRLSAKLPDCEFEAKFTILSYDVYLSTKHSNQEFVIQGADFSRSLVEAIQAMQKGDKIYFENIRCIGPDQKIRNLGSKEITLL